LPLFNSVALRKTIRTYKIYCRSVCCPLTPLNLHLYFVEFVVLLLRTSIRSTCVRETVSRLVTLLAGRLLFDIIQRQELFPFSTPPRRAPDQLDPYVIAGGGFIRWERVKRSERETYRLISQWQFLPHCELHACTTGWYAAITLTVVYPDEHRKTIFYSFI